MKRKTLIGLSTCYLVAFTIGNGFLPLMPIYAQLLGASREIAGCYVAFAFLCIAAGAPLGGRVSDLVRHTRLFLAGAGAALIPANWLIGRVETVWQLALVTGAQWLIAGICLGIVGAVAG